MLLHEVCHPQDAQGCPISLAVLTLCKPIWSVKPTKLAFEELKLSKVLISAFVPSSKDCYILDQGGLKIFVWKGKNANKEEKQQAMSRALVGAELGVSYGIAWLFPGVLSTPCPCFASGSLQAFIKAKNYPASTTVETENDGSESTIFRQLFQKWTVPNQTSGLGKTHTVGKVGECPLLMPQQSLDWYGGAVGTPCLAGYDSFLCLSSQPRWSR